MTGQHRKWPHRRLGAGVWLLAAVGVLAATGLKAQERRLRTVRGFVVDASGAPVPNAIVYLKNLHTQSVRTFIAESEGRFRFSGLDPNVDYELYAEHGDLASPHRTISSFDTRPEIVVTLKLVRKKSG
jgi:protocatechuate 3,4-dioxygenase beta subunit